MIRLSHKSKLDRLMFPSRLSFQPILILILFIIYAYVPSFVFAASPEKKEIKNVFDYKVMKRFNIGIKDIPENSVIYNKPFSVYEEYRWQIIGIVLFMSAQTLLIAAMLINQRKRKQAEEKINNYQERLKALASQLILTEEKKRRRIAVDLHDQIGQSLALGRIQIAAAKKSAADDGIAARLDEISEILRETVQDTRHLIFDLSPPAMHEIGLGAAVSEWLEEQIEKRYGIKTEFFDNIEQSYRKTLDDNVRAILFRNVRELLVNVVKHAQANQVTVLMEVTDGVLKIVVQDDGVGFDSRALSQPEGIKGGFGLFSIEERMTDLGGAFEIESKPGKGGRAILTVPLELD